MRSRELLVEQSKMALAKQDERFQERERGLTEWGERLNVRERGLTARDEGLQVKETGLNERDGQLQERGGGDTDAGDEEIGGDEEGGGGGAWREAPIYLVRQWLHPARGNHDEDENSNVWLLDLQFRFPGRLYSARSQNEGPPCSLCVLREQSFAVVMLLIVGPVMQAKSDFSTI